MYNNSVLKILADMPTKLSAKNLEVLQSVIDKDKLAYSIEMNRDMCGEYAPFCSFCDKTITYPCAAAFVKFKQSEGLQLEIAVSKDENAVEGNTLNNTSGNVTEVRSENEENMKEFTKPQSEAEIIVSKTSDLQSDKNLITEETSREEEAKPEENIKVKNRIRIAVAKRKN